MRNQPLQISQKIARDQTRHEIIILFHDSPLKSWQSGSKFVAISCRENRESGVNFVYTYIEPERERESETGCVHRCVGKARIRELNTCSTGERYECEALDVAWTFVIVTILSILGHPLIGLTARRSNINPSTCNARYGRAIK